MLLWPWVLRSKQTNVKCNKQVWGAKPLWGRVNPHYTKVSGLPLGLDSISELTPAGRPVPRTLLPSLMYTQGSENSEAELVQPRWKHGESQCLPKRDRRSLVGKKTSCFQVLEGMTRRVNSEPLNISPLSCLRSRWSLFLALGTFERTYVNVDFRSVSNYIL